MLVARMPQPIQAMQSEVVSPPVVQEHPEGNPPRAMKRPREPAVLDPDSDDFLEGDDEPQQLELRVLRRSRHELIIVATSVHTV